MKCYAYKTAEGKVKLIHAKNNVEERISAIDPTATFLGELSSESPSRSFRNSWKEQDGSVVVDMVSAKEAKMQKIRSKRDELLKESDAIWVEIASKDEAQADIQAYKQALRDMTAAEQTAVDAITTAEALEAYEPTYPTKP